MSLSVYDVYFELICLLSFTRNTVLMTLDGGMSFLYLVNVRNAGKCLCNSQIFAGYRALIQ